MLGMMLAGIWDRMDSRFMDLNKVWLSINVKFKKLRWANMVDAKFIPARVLL